MSVRTHSRLHREGGDGVELVAAGGAVEQLREVKDAERAGGGSPRPQELASAALERVLERGLVGRTERVVALRAGAGDAGGRRHRTRRFPRSSPRAPTVRCRTPCPRDVEIPRGALVVVDWGARLDGYCSDCTRTVATGARSTATRSRSTSWCARAQEPGPGRGPRRRRVQGGGRGGAQT